MPNNKNGGPRLRRRDWLVAAAGPALLAACGGGDQAAPASAGAPATPMAGQPPMADLLAGELSDAFFTYLQLSAGKALNAQQALRQTAHVKGNAGRTALLDQWIASQSALLASLRSFRAGIAPLRAGTVSSVVLAPAAGSMPALVLDRTGLAAMDMTFAVYLAALLDPGTPQAATARHPMAGLDMGKVADSMRLNKNVLAVDNAILGNTTTPVQKVLGYVATAAAIGGIVLLAVGASGILVPTAIGATVWGVGAAAGSMLATMGVLTGLANAAASTYAVFDAANPADRAAQWRGVLDGATQTVRALADGAAAVAAPTSVAGQTFGFANNALKNWELQRAGAGSMEIVVEAVTASAETTIADRINSIDLAAPNLPDSPRDGPSTASLGSGSDEVETPLDAKGDGRMLVPGTLAQNPGTMCVNDPEDGTLLAANTPGPLEEGVLLVLAAPGCGFAGSYGGSFAGQDHGPVSATVAANGTVAASGTSLRFGHAVLAAGSVSTSGQFLAVAGSTADGATFTGRLLSSSSGWTLAGTWSNASTGMSGTFSLARAGCG